MSMRSFHARQGRPRPAAADRPERVSGSTRADLLLVRQGLAASRTEARAHIEAGRVRWIDGIVTKPAREFPNGTRFVVTPSNENRHVSRGGLKLAGALRASGLPVAGRICLDVGQSTGGFTDCLLQAGAARVVGVDVGHGQLHPRLVGDARVTAFEGVNCRTLAAADLGNAMPAGGFDLIVADVSFISLTLVLPCLPVLLGADGDMLLLVKPQFEAGPDGVGKGGIVRDPKYHTAAAERLEACARTLRLRVRGWFDSPITGGDGNREFFTWLSHD
ncbi:MAG: TlyA family RNA methyltransferase [Zoogloeaceae bacterium]|jgi:23S rRNA (cytidine1920-2'-O)/16S rRNA (cytidine1409-2'-O)-methyltransferase|nr:TlyA family RNA methyltransferase [Zoogloeaceae bacterium]